MPFRNDQKSTDFAETRHLPESVWRVQLGLHTQTIKKAIALTQRQAVHKPRLRRFYKAADQFLNGDCTDSDGYYIEQAVLVPL
jgi:hypothetical protein